MALFRSVVVGALIASVWFVLDSLFLGRQQTYGYIGVAGAATAGYLVRGAVR